MNIIFLTICRIGDIEMRDIYTDLMRKFRSENALFTWLHHVNG